MISDTLFEAARDIRRYMVEFPAAYADRAERLEALLTEMDAIRIELDTPPTEAMGEPPAPLDVRDLLRRYMATVLSVEGVDFLPREVGAFTQVELDELNAISREAHQIAQEA